jgi:trigger factor
MQVSVESTGGLERRATVQVPAERVDGEVEKRLISLGKSAKIKGFRPGKVPLKVVRRHYGSQVRAEVLGEVLRSTWHEAVSQEKLTPAGGPRIEPVNTEPGQDLEYTATFEAYPDVDPKGLEDLQVQRPLAEVSEADVDAMVGNLREQRAVWEPAERPAERGDRLEIDFEGDIQGAPFPGNRGKEAKVVLGEGRMVAGFEEGLIGAGAGEERDLNVSFPEDYPSEEVAGKEAHFKVNVRVVEARELPQVDAAFAKSFGIESGDLEEFRADIRANMERELANAVRRRLKTQVLDALLRDNPVELPGALVEDEIRRMREEAFQRIGVESMKNAPELPDELFAEQARRRVALGLIVGEIIKREEMKPDPARVEETLDALTDNYPDPEELARAYRASPDAMQQVEAMALEEQVVDRLLDRAEVNEQPTTFGALMNFNVGADAEGEENAERREVINQ